MPEAVPTGLRERFLAKVDPDGPIPSHAPHLGKCHLWLAAKDPNGYGRFGIGKKVHLAHRVSFFLEHGRWPDDCALHHCDNPPCVNPEHLFDGTLSDNAVDMYAKGRATKKKARGERNRLSRLTASTVLAIRNAVAAGATQTAVAQQFGVHQTHVSLIVRRKSWAHI